MDARDRLIFRLEVLQCFSAKRLPVFILFAMLGVFLVVQESELSPLIIVFFTVFAILEPQFNNILFRSPHELEAISMFPISWRRVVFAKNLATIVLTTTLAAMMSMLILYFSPKPLDSDMITDALLYLATIIFPLLHVGNIESLHAPRRNVGFQTDDLVQGMGMFLFVAVLSFPYILFSIVARLPLLNVVYALCLAWFWWAKSIPKTALNIEQKKTMVCATI